MVQIGRAVASATDLGLDARIQGIAVAGDVDLRIYRLVGVLVACHDSTLGRVGVRKKLVARSKGLSKLDISSVIIVRQ